MRRLPLSAILTAAIIILAGCSNKQTPQTDLSLPRAATSQNMQIAMDSLWAKAEAENIELHSVMVVLGDSVVYEHWDNGAHPDSTHVLYSVSKTFTSLGVGLAIDEGLLSLNERIVDIFPDCLPDSVSDNLADITVEHLLTMSCGHAHEHLSEIRELSAADSTLNWVRQFMSYPVEYKPGTVFCYNSVGTFLLSAAIQRRSGQKLIDYLTPRLFEPLGIEGAHWDETPEGINAGGWGLWLKTEDLAKTGRLMLNRGNWNGQQIVPADWIDNMTGRHIQSVQGTPNSLEYIPTDEDYINSDWVQGYGYQVWRCRHNAFRADGSFGQFIVVIPDRNTVVALTANSHSYQKEINLVWDYIVPAIDEIQQNSPAATEKK